MRILIFHGYLLEGTGSNVYNSRLAAALVGLGHDVHLLCQDRHPERQAFVEQVGDWDGGELRLRALGRRGEDGSEHEDGDGDEGAGERKSMGAKRDGGSCTVYRPDIGGLLPVYVADRYEGVETKTFAQCSDLEVERYVEANVAAVRELRSRVDPEIALANHLVMGPVILARGLGGRVPYAVKVHGSALEYTVKPDPERFLEPAREGLAGASCVLVGSAHTAGSLWRALGDPELPRRTRLGPPGVDVELFAPRERAGAREGLRALARRLGAGAASTPRPPGADSTPRPSDPASGHEPVSGLDAFARDHTAAAEALERVDPEHDRLVAFVGKLIVSKGVDLLLAAWPLVLEQAPDARLLVVGFGAYRDGLERLLEALAAGELDRARAIAQVGRALEVAEPAGPPARERPLRHLLAFLDGLTADARARERYLAAARALGERVVLTGRLDHDELAEILPACEALVVPSTFPEAFGMVAAEAAACGVLPVSAAHSGLAEVSEELARAVPRQVAPLLSFPVDDSSVSAIAERVVAWLTADPALRAPARDGLVATVRERWSWQGVARGVIAAAQGRLDTLAEP
jgi:glycosyltransferase involved in cell wall biosynthesis